MHIETDKLVNSYLETIKAMGLEVQKTLDIEEWVILAVKFKGFDLGISFERSDPNFVRTYIYGFYDVNDSNRIDVYRSVQKAQDLTMGKYSLSDNKDSLSVEMQFYTTSYEIMPESLTSYFDWLIDGKNTFAELMENKNT